MMELSKEINKLSEEIKSTQKIMTALGDEMRREGTKNYYYFDADMEAFDRLMGMLAHAKEIMMKLPDRSGND